MERPSDVALRKRAAPLFWTFLKAKSSLQRTKKEDPECPDRPCVLFLGFPQWTNTWGIAGSQVQRFYLADVRYGGAKHLFVALVYPDQASDMKTFSKIGEQLLRTVRVPATTG